MIIVTSLVCHLMYGLSNCVRTDPSRLMLQVHGVRSSHSSVCEVVQHSWFLTIHGDTSFPEPHGFSCLIIHNMF